MKNVVIVDGLRTPFIKAWTDFMEIPAQDLGTTVIRELLEINLRGTNIKNRINRNVRMVQDCWQIRNTSLNGHVRIA